VTSLNVTDIVSFSLVAAKTPPEENEIKQKQAQRRAAGDRSG